MSEQSITSEVDPARGFVRVRVRGLLKSVDADRVQQALMSMKMDDRVVLVMRHFSDCSYREIAVVLDLEEKTVKSRLFEARQRLGELLKDLRTN